MKLQDKLDNKQILTEDKKLNSSQQEVSEQSYVDALAHIDTEEELVEHIVNRVLGTPDREDLIYELKTKIQNRMYKIDSEQIAQALLDESDIIQKSYLYSNHKS